MPKLKTYLVGYLIKLSRSLISILVFLLYINKLNYVLGSQVGNPQFADDLVVYSSGFTFYCKQLKSSSKQIK